MPAQSKTERRQEESVGVETQAIDATVAERGPWHAEATRLYAFMTHDLRRPAAARCCAGVHSFPCCALISICINWVRLQCFSWWLDGRLTLVGSAALCTLFLCALSLCVA